MPDAFSNVKSGDPIPTDGRLWNALIDSVRAKPPEVIQQWDPTKFAAGIIDVKAVSSGSIWRPFFLNAPQLTPTGGYSDTNGLVFWRDKGVVDSLSAPPGNPPDSKWGGRMAIALAPHTTGNIVKAMTVGIFPAIVYAGTTAGGEFGALPRFVTPYNAAAGIWWGGGFDYYKDAGTQAPAEVVWFDGDNLGANGGAVWALLRFRTPEAVTLHSETMAWPSGWEAAANGTTLWPFVTSAFAGRLVGAASPAGISVKVPCEFVLKVSGVWNPGLFTETSLSKVYCSASSGGAVTQALHILPEQKLSVAAKVTAFGGGVTTTTVKEFTIQPALRKLATTADVGHGPIPFEVSFDMSPKAKLELNVPYTIGFVAAESLPSGGGTIGSTVGKIKPTSCELVTWNEALWNKTGYSGGKNPTSPLG